MTICRHQIGSRNGWAHAVVPLLLIALTSPACANASNQADERGRSAPASEAAPPNKQVPEDHPAKTTTSKPTPPRTDERSADRSRMVERQIRARGIDDRRVLAAMRAVPRHWFVPRPQIKYAYDDRPLPIGWGQTISQPYIVALMTELLELKPGEKVLEIGTGSGYQAAVLAELTDQVYTIEIVEPLAKRTIELMKQKGYDTVRCRISDGYRGWPEHAPFDAIIVTCAPESPPKALVDQLAPGGRMCIPVGPQRGAQELILLKKGSDGRLKRHRVEWVRFVPMTGQPDGGDD
ncbi:MAG: protein-L-isoaspartate(D-aspartate) O-methyltransferase [bacterium]|nr:protein-L-isoaspartate(D-aspartate) O-methyltransferase [bacterium]